MSKGTAVITGVANWSSLCSTDAGFVIGQKIAADGGQFCI